MKEYQSDVYESGIATSLPTASPAMQSWIEEVMTEIPRQLLQLMRPAPAKPASEPT